MHAATMGIQGTLNRETVSTRSGTHHTCKIGDYGDESAKTPQSGNRCRFRFVFVSCVRAPHIPASWIPGVLPHTRQLDPRSPTTYTHQMDPKSPTTYTRQLDSRSPATSKRIYLSAGVQESHQILAGWGQALALASGPGLQAWPRPQKNLNSLKQKFVFFL